MNAFINKLNDHEVEKNTAEYFGSHKAAIEEWGTFKDSLKAPIHRWFTYPAGFSYKAVEASFRSNGIREGDTIYDPFMGSATTNVVAKTKGINSYGVEAHPFVFKIARTKLQWATSRAKLETALSEIETFIRRREINKLRIEKKLALEFPELILKCYEKKTLVDLYLIRESLKVIDYSQPVRDVLYVALVALLRQVSSAATGWPYIAPKKVKTSSLSKDALTEYKKVVCQMGSDIDEVKSGADLNWKKSVHKIYNADARKTQKLIHSETIDHIFTSPPYLNNFDYADRTRLELYFFGEAKNWSDISLNVRTKLITSATTQISRNDPRYNLSESIDFCAPNAYGEIRAAIESLEKIRKIKGGKKSYDHLVSGYFNDMFLILQEMYRVLKSGTRAELVLGDSAPYGVHIRTEILLGQIALGLGFKKFTVNQLRKRGEKWKGNSQRHHVALQESILTVYK